MIHVIATVQAHSGRRADVLAEFQKLVPQVRAEEGCLEYGAALDVAADIPAQQSTGDDVFLVVEKWESLDHLKAHLAAAHMAAYRESVKNLVASVALNILQPV